MNLRDPNLAVTPNSASEALGIFEKQSARATVVAGTVLPALAALLAAFGVAFGIDLIVRGRLEQPERAVMLAGAFLTAVMVLPVALHLARQRSAARIDRLALLALSSVAVVLVGIYLYWVSFPVQFPGDILIWSESDFVNDIVKFRLGYPLYTAQVNNESFVYMPGTQLLTYFLAVLLGSPTSIAVYRMVQVGFTLLAALIATLCAQLISARARPWRETPRSAAALWFPILLLIATNPLTNPFVHELHGDALAQLFSVVAYLFLVLYATTGNSRLLWIMALMPALGFFIKQSLAIWALLYCIQLALFQRPFSLKRLVLFAAISFGGVAAVAGLSYWIWGEHFVYWIFTVLGSHEVSPLRSFQHLLDAWIYFLLGLVGGLILLRGKPMQVLLGPWAIWLLLITSETYTSGIAWMINHIGPGCLIGGIWFVAGLTRVWELLFRGSLRTLRLSTALRSLIAFASLVLILAGLQVIRIPLSPIPADAYRYLDEIEAQFAGESSKNVLMDAGSWVYARENVIMPDRAPSIGERGYTETGDFSGILQRLNEKRYSKILVRNFDSPDFWYDHYLWRQSSGIRRALLDNYRVVGKIRAVQTGGYEPDLGYLFQEITILEPKPH